MEQGRKHQDGSILEHLESRIDFNEILSVLNANKWLVIICAAIALVLGVFYVERIPFSYSADLLIQVEDKNSSNILGKNPVIASLNSNASTPADVQSVLIRSYYVLEPVIHQLGLDLSVSPDYFPIIGRWYASHHQNKLSRPFLGLSKFAWGGETVKIDQFSVPRQFVNKQLMLVALDNKQYQVRDKNNQLLFTGQVGKLENIILPAYGKFTINVATLNANPGMRFFVRKGDSKKIVNALSNQLQIDDLGSLDQVASKTGILRIRMVGGDPDAIVNILNTIANVAVQKDMEKKSAEFVQTLQFLKQERSLLKSSVNKAATELSVYQSKSGVIDLSDTTKALSVQIADFRKQLYKIQLQKSLALQKFTPLHPYILALDDQEQRAREQLNHLKQSEKNLPDKERQAAMLINDAKVKAELYAQLLNKIQSLQVMKVGTTSDIQILDYAKIPVAPLPINKIMILFSCMVIGAGMAAFYVIFKTVLHAKVLDPNEIESRHALTNMANIPYSQEQKNVVDSYNAKIELVPLIAKVAPRSLTVEALRSFRTSLKIAMFDQTSNVINISGIAPGIGKSFISANLAFLLADSGKKVLLIDGDMRKGHLKNYFKIGNCLGLSELLAGSVGIDDIIIKNGFANLDFIATGNYPENPSELLLKPQLKKLLDSVSPIYDHIIIDTPPILAVTDAAIIAECSGLNFMVVGAGKHEMKEIDFALQRFSAAGVKINGFVFNASSEQKGLYRQNTHAYQYQYEYK